MLLAVAVLVAANVWWFFLRAPAPREPDFELGAWGGESIPVSSELLAASPSFDSAHHRWTLNGRAVNDLRPLLRSTGEQTDTAEVVDYLPVRLSDDFGATQMRLALLTLVRKRICHVALIDAGAEKAPVHRIVSVRDGQGQLHSCKP
ncbi:hypothetical protein [Novosphingobium resinovorum]|uniref:hypothetical protein n=1 Tax=Novosphingobium resinovorum TaxID=158500 RepID=UPI002ED23F02|nr:hypothetical protein [Novosphingobium resinovorum]